MILVHTLFVLCVIAGLGLVDAAPQTADTAAKDGTTAAPTESPVTAKAEETSTEAAKTEPPKDAAKPEAEKKVEPADGSRSVAAKILREGVETSGDKIVSDESLNSAVDKFVDIIHGKQGINSKAEALPLSLGEKFDFLLLKIPKVGIMKDLKKDDGSDPSRRDKEKAKEDPSGARTLVTNAGIADPNPCPQGGCNNCPCYQQNYPPYTPPEVTGPYNNLNLNAMNPSNDYHDPNCLQAQQQQQQQQLLQVQQQQQLLQFQQQQQQLSTPSYRTPGLYEFDNSAKGLYDYNSQTGFSGNYGQQYYQPADYYGSASNYYNRYPILSQFNSDAYGIPYSYLTSLYPEAQSTVNSNWNNLNLYGYKKR